MLCSMALFTLTKYHPHWIFHFHNNLSFGTKMTLSPLQLWRYTLFTLGMFFPEKNFSPDIENGIEYQYFSRYSIEVRKSSIVTDNTTRNAIVIIQLELQETWKLKKTYLCYYLWHLVKYICMKSCRSTYNLAIALIGCNGGLKSLQGTMWPLDK